MKPYPFKVICPACSEVAFFIDLPSLEVIRKSKMRSEDVYLPDGTQPRAGDIVRCGSCQRRMHRPFQIEPNEQHKPVTV